MLSIRLNAIMKYINPNDHIIDVGCDHALLDIEIAKENKNIIYVSDINRNALNNAIKNINDSKLNDKVIPLLGSGLEVLNSNESVDTLVISGMGTINIINIIKNKNFKKIRKCVFQANNNNNLLRKYMLFHGFKLLHENIVKDGRFYDTMEYVRGFQMLSISSIKYGIVANNEYLKYLISNEESIISSLKGHNISLLINHYFNYLLLAKKLKKSLRFDNISK